MGAPSYSARRRQVPQCHSSALKMEAACPSETSVSVYQTARCHIPEDLPSFANIGCRIDVIDCGGWGVCWEVRGSEFSGFGLLGCDAVESGRRFIVVVSGKKTRHCGRFRRRASRRRVLTTPSDYDCSLWDVTSCDVSVFNVKGALFHPEGGGSTLFRNVCKLFP